VTALDVLVVDEVLGGVAQRRWAERAAARGEETRGVGEWEAGEHDVLGARELDGAGDERALRSGSWCCS
jgi:hypothetical protein